MYIHITMAAPDLSTAPRSALPASQSRSRQTVARLLDAAQRVLSERGLDGATIEAIAREAGVSVGIVYRRFPDKDALLRAAYERYFGTRDAANARSLSAEHWAGKSTREILETFIAAAITGARRERGIIVALSRFAATHDDSAFRAYAARINRATYQRLSAHLLASLEPRRRRHAQERVALALDVLFATLRAYVI